MPDCRSRLVYELKRDSQVLYVLPVESVLGKLPVVPIGDTGTIPFAMRQNARDFADAAFDNSEGSGDGSRWWYIDTWALSSSEPGPANASRSHGENVTLDSLLTHSRQNLDRI